MTTAKQTVSEVRLRVRNECENRHQRLGYGYDGGIVISETLTGTLNQTLTYHYDVGGDFETDVITYADVRTDYGWDNDGLLTGSGRFTIERKPENGLPETVTGGDLSLTRSFSGHGETDSETFEAGIQNFFSWQIDERYNDGAVKQKTEDSSVYVYAYDDMGRLLTVTKDGVLSEEYGYDDFGRRNYEMSVPRGIAGRSLTYDDEDRLITVGSVVYEHDEDGFLEKKTDGSDITEYVYSSRGELLSVTLPDNTVISYVHDPLGRRIAKLVDDVVTEKYLWQGLTRLLAVFNADDTLKMRFEYADARMPVAMTKDGATYYLGYDQVGTLKVVADASGNVVKRIEYDAFGNILSDTDSDFAVPFGFAGGLHDRDTGLIRFGYRDYDPETGRWTAKDPILFAGGDTDLYGYCLNDPVNFIDPDGLDEKIAQAHITFTGKIKITYYEGYYKMELLFQKGVDIHENVHVKQLKPYANWGWFGNTVYMFNNIEWELEAYNAQACYLKDEIKKAKRKSREWNILWDELSRIEFIMKELRDMK